MNYRRRKRAIHHAEAHAEGAAAGAAHVLSASGVPQGEAQLVESDAQIPELVAHIREHRVFAFDTEFIGEETFHPRICLVQLATTERVALIDPLRVGIDALKPVWECVCDPTLLTLVHAGGQDVDAAQRGAGSAAVNVVDTQIASAFVGMPWPTSLGNMVEGLLGHRLHKGHTFTEWDARPLTRSQLGYAADDVRYLPLAWTRLSERLSQRSRMPWALAESSASIRAVEGFDPESHVRRACRGLSLRPRVMTILRELVVLRHTIAGELNKPPRAVLPDGAMLEIARRKPESVADLADVRGMPRPIVQSHGERILSTVQLAKSLPVEHDRIWTPPEESSEDRMRIDALWSVVTMRCIAMGVAPGIILTRAELSRWYLGRKGGAAGPLFPADDWRRDALGDWIERFVAGEGTLSLRWSDSGPTAS
jgi:ribonuclease D